MLSFLLVLITFVHSDDTPLKVIPELNVKKYLGVWYEIGSIPMRFQKGCTCTKATYSEKPDSDLLKVKNECIKEDGLSLAEGQARFQTEKKNGKLEVNFFFIFWGDYWIVELGEKYDYAVISGEDKDSLWVLSRKRKMDETQLKKILERAKKMGIKTGEFKKTKQEGCK